MRPVVYALIAAIIACVVQTADACPRCGRSYCYGCKPIDTSKKLKPYGTNKAKAAKAADPVATKPLAEQGNTQLFRGLKPEDVKSLVQQLIAGGKMFADGGDRNYSRAADAQQRASNVVSNLTRGLATEGQINALTNLVDKLQTQTESREESSQSNGSTTPENPADPLNDSARSFQFGRAAHVAGFQVIASVKCADCHTNGKANGGYDLSDVSKLTPFQWKRVAEVTDPLCTTKRMPPEGPRLTLEMRAPAIVAGYGK